MIKIIKHGKRFPDTKVGTCHKCECIIECSPSDMTYPDIPAQHPYVPCPNDNCNAHIVNFKDKDYGPNPV